MREIDELEAKILRLVEEVVAAKSSDLAAVGLRASIQPPFRMTSEGGMTSEIPIYFYAGTNLEDAIEVPVYWGRQPAADEVELRTWLEECISDVMRVWTERD